MVIVQKHMDFHMMKRASAVCVTRDKQATGQNQWWDYAFSCRDNVREHSSSVEMV